MQLTKGAIGNLINRYKAVLKKCHLMNVFGSLAVAGMLVMGGAGVAGAAGPDVALGGGGTYNKGGAVDHLLGGGLYEGNVLITEANTPVAHDISLTVTGGAISEIIGGSYISGTNADITTATHGTITTVISGETTSSEFVVGGSKLANNNLGSDKTSSLTTGETKLTIHNGTFGKEGKTNAYELVMGGNYVKTGTAANGTATTQGSSVTVNDGKFHASVVGGSVAHRYDGTGVSTVTDNGNTSVVINGGTFNPSESSYTDANGGINLKAAVIGGGLAYGANTSTVLGSKDAPANSSVSISGGAVINGKVVAGSMVANGGYAALIHGDTLLNMSGGTVKDDLVGGGMVQDAATLPEGSTQPDHNLIITGNAAVTVAGGTATGEIIGGNYVRGEGSARVANSLVTITGGTFAAADATVGKAQYVIGGNKAMAYAGKTAKTLVENNSGVLVDGDVTIADGAVVGGSMAKATGTGNASAIVEGNSGVQVNKGTLAGVVGGGLAETYSVAGGSASSQVGGFDVKSTSFVAINGGTINGIAHGAVAGNAGTSSAAVVGGGMANGDNASATVDNTNVSITGGKINGKVVAGGLAINGGTTTAGGNTLLTMTGGEVSGDLIGGNLLEKNGKEGSNTASSTVNVEDGTVAGEIYGGSYVRNTAATSAVTNTTVNISGGTIGATVPQAWAQYVVGGGKAMSNATDTESNVLETAAVNISGGNITRGAVVGGGFARAQSSSGSATATVTDSVVNLTGGSLVGVVGGGLAENLGTPGSTAKATAGVINATLTIGGDATVNGIIYKANDGAVEAPSSAAVIGGGLAYSKNGSNADASVKTANTTINGGTIKGAVYAGGMADGANATANVETAKLTINGGTIKGDVYAGGYALAGGTADVTTANVTLKGGEVTGKVAVGNAAAATVTLDGTGAKVAGGFEGNKNSTLAFNNYNGKFDNVAIGFGILDVAENSNVYVDALVSGQRGSDRPNSGIFGAPTPVPGGGPVTHHPLTITGGGTVTANEFHVNPDASVTIAHGNVVANNVKIQSATLTVGNGTASAGFTANNDLLFEKSPGHPDDPSMQINNLGTVTLSKASVLGADGKIDTTLFDNDQIQVNTGGTLRLDGLEGPLTEAELAALKSTTKGGLLDLGGADLGVAPDADGNVSYDKVQGITSDSLKDATVAVSDASNADGVSGGFQSAKLVGNEKELNAKGTLALAGSQNGTSLVMDKDGELANLRVGGAYGSQDTSAVTLGRKDYNNKGELGKVTMNAGSGKSATLNVVGAGQAEFTVGDIRANESTNTINVDGATLNTGNIAAETGLPALNNMNITSGVVNARGDANVTNVVLDNGALTASEVAGAGAPAGGNITVDSLAGQGAVIADNALTMNNAYNGAETDALAMKANELNTTDLDSTAGTVAIDVARWKATGTTTLKDDTVVLTETGTFTGAFSMDGGAVVAQGTADAPATLTFQDDATFTNGAVAAVDKIEMTGTNTSLTVGEANSDGVSLVVKEMTTTPGGTLTFDPDWGHASNNAAIEKLNYTPATDSNAVNNALQVGRNSYVALGTTDQSWLPSVVQGGLREDGVETVLGLAKTLVVQSTGSIELNSDAGYGGVAWTGTPNTATFGDNSLLVIDGNTLYGDKAAISLETKGTLKVDAGARLLVTDAVDGQAYTIVGNVNDPGADLAGWKNNGMTSTTDMISLGDAVFDGVDKVTTSAVRNDAHTVFPNLSDGMADAVNDLYTGHAGATAGDPGWDYANVNSDDMGVRFLSRATDNRFLGKDKDAAAATIESAARIAFAGAVPQMTRMASDAGTNAVVNRLGFANPADGAQAMDAEGRIVDRNTTGFALWIAPLWQNQSGWGMEAGELDYGFNGNLGGVSLGADYTFENALRAGITFNIGGGYAETSGGDLNNTRNNMNFWGLGAYAGWNYENFGLMADISYTSTWNELKQDVDGRMGMGDLEADVQATAISAGLRAEYLLQTSVMDIIPHIGVRYMSLNTWGYDVDTHGGTVLEGDGFHQDIWTFPVGVTFSKDFALDNGFTFKPSVDFSVIPAAGDIKAKHDVAFTGLPGSYEVETQMMDYLTWQGGVGLELGNDVMSFGVNYTLQAGQHSTGHGLFGSFRYEF